MITTVCKISYGSQTVPPIVPAVQGDTGRAISFEIADFTPPAGATATYFILKPSGEAIYNSATITDNSILCELTAQSLAEAGENRMQVRVLHGEDIVTSFEVILMVRTFLGDDAMESGTEMNIFDQAVAQATEQFQENAEQIVAEVIESIPEDYTELTEEVGQLNERLLSDDTPVADSVTDWTSLGFNSPSANNTVYCTTSTTRISMNNRIPVTPGMGVKITCESGYKYRAIFFTNSGAINSGTAYSFVTGYNDDPATWHTDAERFLIVPANAKGLCVCVADINDGTITTSAYTNVDIKFVSLSGRVKIVEEEIAEIPTDIDDAIFEQTGQLVISDASSWARGNVAPSGNVSSSTTRCYDTVHHLVDTRHQSTAKYIKITCPSTIKNRITFYSSDAISSTYLVPSASNDNWTNGSQVFEVPSTAVMCAVSVAFIDDATINTSDCANVRVQQIIVKEAVLNPYEGTIISILGDSISTYAGENAESAGDNHTIADGTYTYEGNHCRYPNSYLTNVNQTYWMKLITKLSAKLGVNDSWAGSRVSWNGQEGSDIGADIYIASPTRIGHLDDNGTPNYILVNAGTNDIGTNVTVGTFNTESPVNYTDEQIASLPVDTFADAYRAMLIRLQKTYPLARIVVMLPNYTTSYYNPTKADQYLEIIKEACDYFGIPWIDMRTSGITMYNTGTYTGDGIHPNPKGMTLLYEKVLKAFLYSV